MYDEVDVKRMTLALRAAADAAESGEVPVGAVVFHHDRIVGRAHNQREMLQDPTAHAEILAITQAASALGSWRLDDCTMYVTLEPCAMCAGALVLARMSRLVFGAHDPKAGACGSVLDVLACERLNHTVDVVSGVLAEPCGRILSDFFGERRRQRDENGRP
ncbi:MAG: tRNA adenosine(34) deaminase TadA [Planctomycetes bacterium]|nr:tRNA adenosine(34) deaminase TadA [Planctomycetota bacterium]